MSLLSRAISSVATLLVGEEEAARSPEPVRNASPHDRVEVSAEHASANSASDEDRGKQAERASPSPAEALTTVDLSSSPVSRVDERDGALAELAAIEEREGKLAEFALPTPEKPRAARAEEAGSADSAANSETRRASVGDAQGDELQVQLGRAYELLQASAAELRRKNAELRALLSENERLVVHLRSLERSLGASESQGREWSSQLRELQSRLRESGAAESQLREQLAAAVDLRHRLESRVEELESRLAQQVSARDGSLARRESLASAGGGDDACSEESGEQHEARVERDLVRQLKTEVSTLAAELDRREARRRELEHRAGAAESALARLAERISASAPPPEQGLCRPEEIIAEAGARMAQLEAAAAANVELAQRAEDAERRARENEASLADAAAEAKRAAHEISSLKLELEQTRARLCVLDEAVKSQSHATAPSAQEFAPELDAAKTRAAELAAALARVEAELAATRAAQQALATRASAAEAAVREAQSKLSESEQAVSVERDLVRILRQEVQNLSSESALRSSLEQQLALKAEELERYALESEQRDRTAATHISRAQRDAENASRLLENERDLVRVLKQEVQRLSLESERRSVLENQLAELAAAGERRVAEMTARSQADAETISGLRRELEVLQGKLSVQDAAAAIGQRGDKSLPVSGCGEVDDADQDLTASVAARQQAPPGRSGERRDRSLNASLIRAARALHAALAQNGALRTELQAVERRAQRAESSALELSREKESLQQLIREHESRSSKVQQESGSNLALFEQRATFAESEARKAEAARLSLAEELRVARAELTALRDCVDSAVCQAETKECEAEDALAASACHLQRAKAVEALLGLREEAMRLAEREHHALRQELAATKEMASATQEQLAKAMKQIAIDMQEREELGRKLEAEKAERAALQARLAEVEARARETEGHLREAMRSGIDAMRQQLQAALSESHALRNQPQDSAGVARVAELEQQLHLARQSLHAERDSAEALRHQSANIAKLQSALNEKERELASANRERSGLAAELQSAQEQRARAETALVDSQRHAHLFETRMEAMSRKFQEDLRTREEKIAFMTERAAQLEAQLGLVRQREDNLMRHLQQQQLKAAGDSAELLQLVGALRAEVVALQAARDRAAREIARTPSGRARRVHDRLQQASESPIPARRARKTDYEGEPRAADRKGATATRGDPLLESIRAKEMRLKELTAARAGYRAGVGTPLPVTPEAAHRALAGAPHGATSDNSLTGQSPPNKPGDHQPC